MCVKGVKGSGLVNLGAALGARLLGGLDERRARVLLNGHVAHALAVPLTPLLLAQLLARLRRGRVGAGERVLENVRRNPGEALE